MGDWPIIAAIALAIGVPCYLRGYRKGYAKATADTYGPDALLNSARDRALIDNSSEGCSPRVAARESRRVIERPEHSRAGFTPTIVRGSARTF